MKLTKAQTTYITNAAKRHYKKNKDQFHGFDHALLTAHIAQYIAKHEQADRTICWLAGLLHDIAPKTRGKPHGQHSATIASAILIKGNIKRGAAEIVYGAIANHDSIHRSRINTLEGKIVFEADKLLSMGPIGVLREYGDLLKEGYTHEKASKMLITYLRQYNPLFWTKTGKRLKREFRQLNALFVTLNNKYPSLHN